MLFFSSEITALRYRAGTNIDVYIMDKRPEMENISVHIADNRIDKELRYKIIYSIINENNFSEDFKLKIIDAISE